MREGTRFAHWGHSDFRESSVSAFDHQRGRPIEVSGARIYTETLGAGDAPVLVLLHGGFGNIEDFNRLLPALEGWRVVGIDSRGHGKSTLGQAGWSYQRAQEDVEQVLAALGVTRCTVLGFSDGGIVALRMGAPQLVVAVPAMMFMLPGLMVFRGMYQIAIENSATFMMAGLFQLFNAMIIIMSIAAGIVLGDVIMRPFTSGLQSNERSRTRRR